MGGLCIRAALQYLTEYDSLFYNYISLSTPHLGSNYKASMIIETGMWIIEKWKNTSSLRQMSMRDSS